MAKYKNGKGHEDKVTKNGRFELINLNSIAIDGGLKRSGKFIDEIDETLNKNDLVMILSDVGHGDLLGRVALIPEYNRFVLNQRVALLRPNSSVDAHFLFAYINQHQKYFKSQGAGMSQLNISKGAVENFTNWIPVLEEQKKIGVFFQSLDDTIDLHLAAIQRQQDLKKAMLQKLFPVNGSTIPTVRFASFSEEWEQRKFEEIVDVRSGRDYKHLYNGDIPVYGTGGYMLSVDKALSYDEDAIGIGRKGTIDKPYLLKAPFWTVDTLFYSVPIKENNLFFINNLFQRVNWKRYDESTGVPSLSKAVINKISAMIPELDEQAKIGKFFKKLDETIALHQQALEKLKLLKQSLLQKMFVN